MILAHTTASWNSHTLHGQHKSHYLMKVCAIIILCNHDHVEIATLRSHLRHTAIPASRRARMSIRPSTQESSALIAQLTLTEHKPGICKLANLHIVHMRASTSLSLVPRSFEGRRNGLVHTVCACVKFFRKTTVKFSVHEPLRRV